MYTQESQHYLIIVITLIAVTVTLPPHCYEPKKKGMCNAYFHRYFYNNSSRQCERFIYGGCGANQNNFKNKDSCEKDCVLSPAGTTGVCQDNNK